MHDYAPRTKKTAANTSPCYANHRGVKYGWSVAFMTGKIMLSVISAMTFSAGMIACGTENAHVISRAKLTFLSHQERPLFLDEVIKRLGPTPPGTEHPFYAYTIADSRTSIEFWMFDRPPSERLRIEISMVVERPANGNPHIIWPHDLKGADIRSVMRKTWPKMYK